MVVIITLLFVVECCYCILVFCFYTSVFSYWCISYFYFCIFFCTFCTYVKFPHFTGARDCLQLVAVYLASEVMAVKIFNVLENAPWSHHSPVMPGRTPRLQSAVTPAGRRYCEPRLKTSYLNPTWYLMYLMNMLNWSPSQPLSFPCYPNDLIFIMLIVIIMTIQMMTPSSLMMMMMIIMIMT